MLGMTLIHDASYSSLNMLILRIRCAVSESARACMHKHSYYEQRHQARLDVFVHKIGSGNIMGKYCSSLR